MNISCIFKRRTNKKMTNRLITLFFFPLLFQLIYAEYRTLNGTYNNLNNPFLPTELARNNPNISFYSVIGEDSTMLVPTPGNYTLAVPINFVNCTSSSNLPKGLYPLPRCVSDLVGSIRTNMNDVYSLGTLEKFKSKRKISHIATFFGFFMVTDLISGHYEGDSYPTGIYIPQDDELYLSRYAQSPNLAISTPALPFNRSISTPNSAGSNPLTPFVDGSQIYGLSEEQLSQIRNYGNHGTMLLYYNDDTEDSSFGYPPKDIYGEYIFGFIPRKGRNLFTDMFYLIFLREHNRKCDELWGIHGDTWTDDWYFEECRKWVIGLLQRVAFYEYLGIVLGSPLPPYKGYNPNLEPNIDTFFATVTYRYGHSEMSDYYNIVNDKGNVLATLPLNSLQIPHLLETYGVPVMALSLALQRQEEIDIYFADSMRKFVAQFQNRTEEMDIISLDVIRSRDHAIPLYNDAREAMGLSRAIEWSDITNNTEVLQRLVDTYDNIDVVEAFFGGLAEDHYKGSDFGELFYKSFYDQWINIRDSDRFWYEAPDAGFTQDEIDEINNTTLSQIIARNTPTTYQLPPNIWIVQPATSLKTITDVPIDPNDINNPNNINYQTQNDIISTDYPPLNHVMLSDIFEVYWKIVKDEIYFKLVIASTTSWFSIGFNDKDNMITSDMIICRNTNNNIEVRQYKSNGYFTPELINEQDQLIKVRRIEFRNGIYSLVEVSRPLSVKGSTLKPITESKLISMIYAWNPNNNVITYHAGNKGSMKMDFFSTTQLSEMIIKRRKNLLSHGIAMFLVYAILYPISIWRVRYMKTKGSYMKKHRNLQMLGTLIVAIFGGIALAISKGYLVKTNHGIIGITIFCVMGIQIGLGLFNMWSLINVESVNMGIMKLLRRIHCIFGFIIVISSWVNMCFGIYEYRKQFDSNKYWSIVYLVWIGILIIIFIISENIFRVRDMRFRYSKILGDKTTKPKQQLRNFIKNYDQLPMITLDEFNQRVIRGMKLVKVENIIFDISKWIKYHPGGTKILQRVIGSDITHDFFGGDRSSSKLESNFDDDEYDTIRYEDEKKNPSIIMMKKSNKDDESLANLIDAFNISKTFRKKSSRVSVHIHSRYATEKLATMAVARLSDENEMGTIIARSQQLAPQQYQQHYTSQYYEPQVDHPNISSSSTFRRCIITDIEIVTSNQNLNSPIVKKFTLKPIHKDDKFPYRRFIPGDYIEIMCDIDQQRIIRPYCPLSQEFSEDYQEDNSSKKMFWILVKIYKDGFMSKYLDKQLKHFEILVRGPFNLSDNMIPKDQTLSISNCILLNPNKPNGCWDNLFMICGGSGITPMLQLIHHHLQEFLKIFRQRRSSMSIFNLYLLFANNSVSDIIYQRHLDYMVKKFMGNFIITQILVNPPDNWNGLKGYIDDVILFEWLSNNLNINTYSTEAEAIPTQIVYYPQQQQYTGSSFDDYNTPLVMHHSSGQQQQRYSSVSQDQSIASSSSHSTVVNHFPNNSKIMVCGNSGFMLSIQNICNRIGVKEKDILFLI